MPSLLRLRSRPTAAKCTAAAAKGAFPFLTEHATASFGSGAGTTASILTWQGRMDAEPDPWPDPNSTFFLSSPPRGCRRQRPMRPERSSRRSLRSSHLLQTTKPMAHRRGEAGMATRHSCMSHVHVHASLRSRCLLRSQCSHTRRRWRMVWLSSRLSAASRSCSCSGVGPAAHNHAHRHAHTGRCCSPKWPCLLLGCTGLIPKQARWCRMP